MSIPDQPLTPEAIDRITTLLRQKGAGWVRLRTFYLAVKLGSIYAAAKALGFTNASPASKRIASLERDLGLVLVERDVNCTEITPAGRAVFALGVMQAEFR